MKAVFEDKTEPKMEMCTEKACGPFWILAFICTLTTERPHPKRGLVTAHHKAAPVVKGALAVLSEEQCWDAGGKARTFLLVPSDLELPAAVAGKVGGVA